jgi:hypothetical protein
VTVPKYGQNTLYVRGVDSVGNLGNVASYEFVAERPSPPVALWGLDTYPGVTQGQALADGQPSLSGDTPLLPTAVTWQSDARLVGGQSASFSGTSHLSTNGSVLDTTNSFAVAAWVRLQDASTDGVVVSQLGVNRARFLVYYSASHGAWRFVTYDSDSSSTAGASVTGTAAVTGQWTHLVGVYDAPNKSIALFVDGVLVGSNTHTASWNASGPVNVGRTVTAGTPAMRFRGLIADVQLFDRTVVGHDFTGQLAADPESGGFDEPGVLTTLEIGRWNFDAALSCFAGSGDVGLCEAPDGSAWGRRLALADGVYADSSGALVNDVWDLDPADPLFGVSTTEFAWSQRNTAPDGQPVVWQDTPVLLTAQSFTVSAWVRVDDEASRHTILSQDDAGGYSGFDLSYRPDNSGEWVFSMRAGRSDSVPANLTSAVAPATNQSNWHHLVGVFDAARRQVRLYVDGLPVQSTAMALAWTAWDADGPLVAGRSDAPGGPGDWLRGAVDDVYVFHGAMSDAAVTTAHDAQVLLREQF